MAVRRRFPIVWLTLTTLVALLMSLYEYLDDVARATGEPASVNFIEEFTGVFAAAVLFPFVRRMARRFPLDGAGRTRAAAVHLLSVMGFSAVHTTLNWASREVLFRAVGLGDYDYGLMPVRYLMEFPIDVIIYTLFAAGTWFVDRHEAARERQLQAARLSTELTEAQLQNLRLQLQPHFLFNALNTISSRMYDDPKAADVMLSQLAELLRAALQTARMQEVPLGVELELLGHYFALLEARFGSALEHGVRVDDAVTRALVPSLVLQPLVENAVRHGNLSRLGRGRVQVTARPEGEWLCLDVEDDGPGMSDVRAKAIVSTAGGGGVGISSTIERLRLLYGAGQGVELSSSTLGGLLVRLRVPLRIAETTHTTFYAAADR
jgi:two-component system, LytTR family, sensor kinase